VEQTSELIIPSNATPSLSEDDSIPLLVQLLISKFRNSKISF
jgi:hypothetical protein